MITRECRNCGYKGQGKMPGSGYLEIFLYFFYFIPGIIYSFWRRDESRRSICPCCNNPHMIPVLV